MMLKMDISTVKRYGFILVASLILALFFSVPGFAQVSDTTGLGGSLPSSGPDVDALLNVYNAILGALVLIWGWVAKAFGLKTKFPNFVFVVVAGALVIAGGFVFYGLTDFLPAAITIIGSMGLFDLLRGAGKATGVVKPKE